MFPRKLDCQTEGRNVDRKWHAVHRFDNARNLATGYTLKALRTQNRLSNLGIERRRHDAVVLYESFPHFGRTVLQKKPDHD